MRRILGVGGLVRMAHHISGLLVLRAHSRFVSIEEEQDTCQSLIEKQLHATHLELLVI